jgi:hypothetical protein
VSLAAASQSTSTRRAFMSPLFPSFSPDLGRDNLRWELLNNLFGI